MTERQAEIARSIVLGESVRAVAARLGVHPQSVRRQLIHVFDETGTWSQAQLVGWTVAHGFVTVPELKQVYCDTDAGVHGEVGSGSVR